MISTVEAQFVSLVISVFAGIASGLLFDLYRSVNYYTRPSKTFLYFMDLLFWLITASVVFAILLRADFAQLRIYTFGGIGIGIFIYFKLFSEYILKLYRWFIYVIVKTIRIIIILLILPFKIVYNLMWYPSNFIKKTANNMFHKVSIWISLKIKPVKNKK